MPNPHPKSISEWGLGEDPRGCPSGFSMRRSEEVAFSARNIILTTRFVTVDDRPITHLEDSPRCVILGFRTAGTRSSMS